MPPPDPFPPAPPGHGPASPATAAAALARQLARHGLAGVYTAASETIAVISVRAGLTAWTDGRRVWCTYDGERYAWFAGETEAVAARLAALARPAET